MSVVQVTMADNGSSVELSRDDTLAVSLKENPTTGFRWEIDIVDEAVLSLARSTFMTAQDAGIGGGGVRQFEFSAVSPGECQIGLKLWRSWTGDSSIRERFSLRVRVKA